MLLHVRRYNTTVLASIFQSFDFAIAAFTAPARPLLTRAAAAERLTGALSGTAPHRSVEDMVGSATSMHHAQRYDVALRTTAVSGEPNQPFADRVSVPTIGTTFLARADSSVLISVLRFLRAIDFEMVGVERG